MENIFKKVIDRVTGAIACGIVDLGKKDLMEVHHLPEFSPKQKVAAISAMIYLFSGKLTTRLEQTVQAQFGISSDNNIDRQEIRVSFEQFNCFCKTIKNGKSGLFLFTSQDSDEALAWSELKSIAPMLEPLIS